MSAIVKGTSLTTDWIEVESFLLLEKKDYVVHINYGIGLFHGIEVLDIQQQKRDYLKIEYAQSSTLYVPIEQVNLVQRYIGKKKGLVLDDMGQKKWEKRKKKVRQEIRGITHSLIELYSKRNRATKKKLNPFKEELIQFMDYFEYKDTPDQKKSFEDICEDMVSKRLMDRLLCGDVGFGKTEVAMRASYLSVLNGAQVALISPTTILSEQHLKSFQRRFKPFSEVKIEVLNRFKSKEESTLILKKLVQGKIDILIGTHRSFSKDVHFKNIGLLIVDEEQKFGVKQKEAIRNKYEFVDTLALSATPIPRSLHMAMLSIRQMSLLKTPPIHRKPVKTYMMKINDKIIKEGILREVERGGQVFFLHNRVEDIYQVGAYIRSIIGESIPIAIAHGQMGEEIEEIMYDFIEGKYSVLVSTAIIDSGIDIPKVNTMIIHGAENFGLSQLYQLKGRVGRSDIQAYAYLLYKNLSQDARDRLEVIMEYKDLGSGLDIAMKDIEIRGVGNLLGESQSGNMDTIGYEMYQNLLDEEIRHQRGEEIEKNCYLELKYSGYIPKDYISSEKEKNSIYKKLSQVTELNILKTIEQDMEKKYGKRPTEMDNIISIAYLKITAHEKELKSIIEKKDKIEIYFKNRERIQFEKLQEKMQLGLLTIQNNENKLMIKKKEDTQTLEYLKNILEEVFQ